MKERYNMTTLDSLLRATLSNTEGTTEIKVSFRKTIQTRPYESETIDIDSSLLVDNNITSMERMLITSILQLELEYTVYSMLALQGKMSTEEFNKEKVSIENAIDSLKTKASTVLDPELYKGILERLEVVIND